MIQSIQRQVERTERERAKALRRLTPRQGAAIVERLLRSRLAFELHFADDHRPVALRYHRRVR